MKKNLLLELSQLFAYKADTLCNNLSATRGISNTIFQLKKSSSSICANIREAQYPQSLPDMLSKFQIAKKECFETEGWLQMLFDSSYISEAEFKIQRNFCGRIRRLLIASCKTIESKINNN